MRRRREYRFSVWTFVAPAALIAAAVVVVNLVQSTLEADTRPTPTTTQQAGQGTGTGGRAQVPRTYRVRAGDTLSGISERFDVPLATLTELNPNLDPNALRPGQRVRLRR